MASEHTRAVSRLATLIALSRDISGTAITPRATMRAKSFTTRRQRQPPPSQG